MVKLFAVNSGISERFSKKTWTFRWHVKVTKRTSNFRFSFATSGHAWSRLTVKGAMPSYFSNFLKSKKVSLHQLNSKNNGLVLSLKTFFTTLKLFPVVCCYGWQGWKWIETWKKLAFKIWSFVFKNHQKKLLWLGLPDKIHLISSLLFTGWSILCLSKGTK